MSISSIFSGLIFGSIGWFVFSQGRKRIENSKVALGLILMIYPILMPSNVWEWVVGIVLCAYTYYIW